MGLLDDIKKLRARAESLNNNHGKPKKTEFDFKEPKPVNDINFAQASIEKNPINDINFAQASIEKNPSPEFSEDIFKKDELKKDDFKKESYAQESLTENDDILDSRVEDKPRVDSKLQAFRNQSRKQSYLYEKKAKKKKKSDFFKKPYKSLHDQTKQEEVKENFYESFNIKILILIISVILIFALVRIESSFRNSHKNKVPSGTKLAKVPNDNNAYYLEKSLIISSGMFINLSKAKLAQNRIKNITEQESKIIKIADYYTIQIGGHYFDKEDAFYVLNELSTSGIKDISLRLQ
ncbi:MAG: hypothetical protein HRT47_02210 [Candidatus Caenarcaniphilales bacterium]|nr:hypothetical protein [Candidatus Caenarcaniphilales bacterium]